MKNKTTISSSTDLPDHLEWFLNLPEKAVANWKELIELGLTEKDVVNCKKLIERKGVPKYYREAVRLLSCSTDRSWTK